MGDAVLATTSLKAIRNSLPRAEITFYASKTVKEILSPSSFCDAWLTQTSKNPFKIAAKLKKHRFSKAILFKNSFGSALTVFLAGIPERIGYSREARGIFLTDKLQPLKSDTGNFIPSPMVDYYSDLAEYIGASPDSKNPELEISDEARKNIEKKFGELSKENPLIIFVPGGAFGPSKCWASNRFAELADRLIENHNAEIVISVANNDKEKKIAAEICDKSSHKLLNLGDNPVTLGELKALFSKAQLVICNDTGPRHIAIALGRKVITLFGPNNPRWTETGYEKETKIIGQAPCVPCDKPVCRQDRHLCMESITVEAVANTADKILTAGK
jgi:heptosyltransferase-2